MYSSKRNSGLNMGGADQTHDTPYQTATSTASARICIAGENIDWMRGSVIAATVSRLGTVVEVAYNPQPMDIVSFDAWPDESFDISQPHLNTPQEVQKAIRLVKSSMAAFRRQFKVESVALKIGAHVPLSGGLSSSTSLCVGIIHSLCKLEQVEYGVRDVAETAYQAEHSFAGVPCGRMDQYVIAHGGILTLDCGTHPIQWNQLSLKKKQSIIIGTSSTGMTFTDSVQDMLSKWKARDQSVVAYKERTSDEIRTIVREIGQHSKITRAAGAAVNRCHDIFSETLGIHNPELDEAVLVARKSGAVCAKSTGGRAHGGSMFAVVNEGSRTTVLAALRASGLRTIETSIG